MYIIYSELNIGTVRYGAVHSLAKNLRCNFYTCAGTSILVFVLTYITYTRTKA